MRKTGTDLIKGEDLDLIIGSVSPYKKEDSDEKKSKKDSDKKSVKKMILKILKDEYGIEENDFESAELEIVPAGLSLSGTGKRYSVPVGVMAEKLHSDAKLAKNTLPVIIGRT